MHGVVWCNVVYCMSCSNNNVNFEDTDRNNIKEQFTRIINNKKLNRTGFKNSPIKYNAVGWVVIDLLTDLV